MKKIFLLIFLVFIANIVLAEGYYHYNTSNRASDKPALHKSIDFTQYMKETQRNIYMNWHPLKSDEKKRVILMFKIAKDGKLLSCDVYKSSGNYAADKAAIQAVEETAPFKPLPSEFEGQSIDVQFLFDYNVFKPTKKK